MSSAESQSPKGTHEYEAFVDKYGGDVKQQYRDTFNLNLTLNDRHYLLIANAVIGPSPNTFKLHPVTYIKAIILDYKLRLLEDITQSLDLLTALTTFRADQPGLFLDALEVPRNKLVLLGLTIVVSGVDFNLLANLTDDAEGLKAVQEISTAASNAASRIEESSEHTTMTGKWLKQELGAKIEDERKRLMAEATEMPILGRIETLEDSEEESAVICMEPEKYDHDVLPSYQATLAGVQQTSEDLVKDVEKHLTAQEAAGIGPDAANALSSDSEADLTTRDNKTATAAVVEVTDSESEIDITNQTNSVTMAARRSTELTKKTNDAFDLLKKCLNAQFLDANDMETASETGKENPQDAGD